MLFQVFSCPMRLLPLLLLLLSGCCRAEEPDTCTPFTYTCGPIAPAAPSKYIARIEAVDLAYNRTNYVEEHYDYYRRLVAVTELAQETFTHTIFYYAINTAVIMTTYFGIEDGRSPVECVVAPASHAAPWMTGPDGSLLAMAPAQSLLFGDNYKYSWINNASQREVPCNRWDACIITTGNGSFQVQYQWSDPTRTFDMFGYTNERPVSARVTGEVYPGQGSTMPVNLDTIFNFVLFDDSPTDEDLNWAFEIPSNVYCPGLPEVKKPPTKLADAFSMRVEVAALTSADPHHIIASSISMWYDYGRKLSRLDSIPAPGTQEAQVAGAVEVAVVSDFTSGVEYVIDKTLGNCTALPIGPGWDTIPSPDGSSYTIQNPLVLFGLGQAANLTYYGTKYARQMPCDVWVGHIDYSYGNDTYEDAYTYEIYFLQSGWREDSGAGVGYEGEYQEPVLIKVQEDYTLSVLPEHLEIDLKQNIFKFEEKEPGMDVFDITPCFTGHDHIRRFQMAFPGSFRDTYDKNPNYFEAEVQSQLSMQLYIPVIRVQHMMIEFNEDDGRLYCEFTLLDAPDVDWVNTPAVGPPLDQVVEDLQQAVSTQFVVVIYDADFDNPGHVQMMVAYNDSLVEMFEDECHPLKQLMEPKRNHNPRKRHSEVAGNGGENTGIRGKGHRREGNGWKKAVTGGKDQEETGEVRNANVVMDEVEVQDTHQRWYLEILHYLVYGTRQHDLQHPQSSYLSAYHITRGITRDGSPTYSPGAMAGMGIGMFLTGLLLGSVIMMVGLRHFGLTGNPEMIPLSARRKTTSDC